MKNLYTILASVLLTVSTFAQSPEGMSYQAVIRNSDDALVSNQTVGMQISILRGTAAGTTVYTVYRETHIPTTNANGLVTLEIGTGTVSVGDFTTIDWSSGPYFIKTETDPTGGTTYSITGTSQLLSVPYALHAKTASSATETQTLADVVALGNSVNNSQLKNVTNPSDAQDAATKAYVDLTANAQTLADVVALGNSANNSQLKNVTNPSDAQDAATKAYVDLLEEQIEAVLDTRITALETEITALETGITALDNRISAIEPATIGQFREGGVVFWVDPTDNAHGLVCAIVDQSEDIAWSNGTDITTGAIDITIGAGLENTTTIITAQGAPESSYAAGLARAYDGGGFNDWFLPSRGELNEMYTNRVTINGTATANGGSNFAASYYWSSSEIDITRVWRQNLDHGFQGSDGKDAEGSNVRAVRAF